MDYARFIMFNVVGGILWIGLFTFGGFYFGNIPAVEENFTLVILAIILLSVMPAIIEFVRSHLSARRAAD
jgi:membrane-associated protein